MTNEVRTYLRDGIVTGIRVGGMLFTPLTRLAEYLSTVTGDRVRLTAERDALRTERQKLRDALIDILDAGDWRWSEADDTTIFTIHLSEKDFTEFSDLATGEPATEAA